MPNHETKSNKYFSKLEGIIFDLDGTLLNTEKLKFLTYYDELKNNIGIKSEKLTRLKNLYVSLVGSTDLDAARKIFETFDIQRVSNNSNYLSDKPWEEFYEMILHQYYLSYGNEKSLKQNTFNQALNTLKEYKIYGKKIAVATSSTRKEALRIIRIIDLEDKIDLLITKDDIKYSKPNPEIYLQTIKKLKIQNNNYVVCIEDSLIGLEAVIAANLPYLAIPNEFTAYPVKNSQIICSRWIVEPFEDLGKRIIDRIENQVLKNNQ